MINIYTLIYSTIICLYIYECMVGVMVSGSKREIGDPCSNSSHAYYNHFCANTGDLLHS